MYVRLYYGTMSAVQHLHYEKVRESQARAWRFKHTKTHINPETWSIETRMPPSLCSGAAYIVLWPHPSSQDLSAADPSEPTPLPSGSRAQSSCKAQENKLLCLEQLQAFTLAQEIQGLGVYSPQHMVTDRPSNCFCFCNS